MGPPHQAAPLPLERVAKLGLKFDPISLEGPCDPGALVILGSFFFTREIELACASVDHVSVDPDTQTISWRLPASKTDTAAYIQCDALLELYLYG
eukprot:541756-Amphidinium_carterae.1